jgi:predicted  nucleic acid-binding Zn-ribbon protein
MSLVNINSYAVAKKNGEGSGGGGTTNISITADNTFGKEIEIWGQMLNFQSPEDITGDFMMSGGAQMRIGGYFTAYNGAYEDQYVQFRPTGNFNFNSVFLLRKTDIKSDGQIGLSGDYTDADGNTSSDILLIWLDRYGLHAKHDMVIDAEKLSIDVDEGHFDLGAKGELMAGTVKTNVVDSYDTGNVTFQPPVIFNDDVDIFGNLNLYKDLYTKNIYNSGEIRTKDLTVTGNLSVFNLIIEQVQAAGGQCVFSPGEFRIQGIGSAKEITAEQNYGVAGGSLVDEKYKVISLYQLAEDEDGQAISNTVVRGDHLLSYTANISADRSSLEARSWWTLVTDSAENEDFYLNGVSRKCNRIDIVTKVYASGQWRDPSWHAVNVKVGDNAVVLGSAQKDRQSAIAIAAHNWIDLEILAPCFIVYREIDGFTLNGKASTYFAKNKSRIASELIVDTTGATLDEIIADIREGQKMYMHEAWANSADGRTDFTKSGNDATFLYKGLCSNNHPEDTELTYKDYIWTLNSAKQGKLIPSRERLYVAADDNLYLDVEYYVKELEGRAFTITAVVTTNGGTETTYQVNESTQETHTRYRRQKIQSDWVSQDWSGQMSRCTVTLYDADSNVLDQRSFDTSYEAGAILSVTDTIKMRVSDSEGDIAVLEVESDAIKTRVTNAEGDISTLEQTATSLTTRISNAEGDISTLEQTATSLTTRITDAEGNVSTLQQTATSLTTRIESAEGDISTLEQTATSLTTRITNTEGDVSSLEQTASSLTTRIANAEGDISSLEQTATRLTSRISNAEGDISTLEQTASSLTSRISNAEGDITELEQSATKWNVVAKQFNSDGSVKASGKV